LVSDVIVGSLANRTKSKCTFITPVLYFTWFIFTCRGENCAV
jgi:hypothetical protein